MVGADKNEDRHEMDDGIRISATDQDEYIHNATEEFGFVPRDVYNGILSLPRTRKEHAAAVKNLSYAELQNLVRTFLCTADSFPNPRIAWSSCPLARQHL